MNKRSSLVLLLLLLLICAAGCGSRDKEQIRTALREMESTASFSGKSPYLTAASEVKKLGTFFTRDITFGQNVVPVSIDSRQALESAAFYARSELDRFSVSLKEEELDVDPEANTAQMLVVAKGSLTMMGESDRLWKDLEISWRKTNETWKISRIQVLETIRQPD